MNKKLTEKLYTLSEACELLSISTATGRNWMKSGKLVSVALSGQKPAFEEATLFALKNALADGSIAGLKNRRNKSYIDGQTTYSNYISKDSPNHAALRKLLETLTQKNLCLDDTMLLYLLRYYAEQLILKAGYTETDVFLPLLEDILDYNSYKAETTKYHFLDKIEITWLSSEDTLGFFYLSLCALGNRKSSGSYYTPAWLAGQLIKKHLPPLNATYTVLDPSCGTGIFLLQLADKLPLQNLYGNDINPLSAALTRINLALKYHITDLEETNLLKKNISSSDFLVKPSGSYNIILGNPPWGARLSAKNKANYRKHFSCASGNSVDIFDLFIEHSLCQLAPGGVLSFVLPEAVLSVKSHTPVRKLLLQHTVLQSVEYLGEVFEQVHCPSIILTVKKDHAGPFFKKVTITLNKENTFSTQIERTIYADSFSFSLTDEEYLLLQKISTCPNHTTLVDKSVFALGIVTGNNSHLLQATPSPGLEPIIKGSSISKYHIANAHHYITFQPDKFQQTAPEQIYRAPEKLFYRFINRQLIFAYDNTGLLSLNSCNIVIPQIPNLSVKYVLAILNSSIAQFFFEKKFHSVKVLRSHLEQIPIPLADEETQKEIVELVNKLMYFKEDSATYKESYQLLDRHVAKLFSLTQNEYDLICSFNFLRSKTEPE